MQPAGQFEALCKSVNAQTLSWMEASPLVAMERRENVPTLERRAWTLQLPSTKKYHMVKPQARFENGIAIVSLACEDKAADEVEACM